MKNTPIIAITMGDPASIGPELTAKLLCTPQKGKEDTSPIEYHPLIIGDTSIMTEALKLTNNKTTTINSITNPDDINSIKTTPPSNQNKTTINILDLQTINFTDITPGQISKKTGESSYRYVEKAIELALAKKVDATVTNAISKEAINLAGHKYAGHTEIYAKLTNTKNYSMMLAHGDIRVVHVSTHVSLRQACDLVKYSRVQQVINTANDACKKLGIKSPRIAVAGLNPHSGEAGMFGTEEIEEIIPAIEEARNRGLNVEGPIPPDTVFPKARGGFYDIVVAMYHDQGHIPLKMEGFVYDKSKGAWDFVAGVNITLGLPIIRASVDHGTAMDQAYKNTASPVSLQNAVEYAVLLAGNTGATS